MGNVHPRRRHRLVLRRPLFFFVLSCVGGMGALTSDARSETVPRADIPPYRDFRHAETPTVPDLRSSFAAAQDEIVVGYFGPFETEKDPDTSLWLAVALAREDIAGECLDSRTLRLVSAWSPSPWTGGTEVLTDLIFRRQVLGIIGSIDGESTHLAETLIAKAHVPLLSSVSTAKSVNLANVPWTFSVLPGDHLIAPKLARHLAASARSLAVISGPDHDSRGFWAELRPHLPAERIALTGLWIVQGEGREESQSLAAIADKVVTTNPACVLITARPVTAARAVIALRAAGYCGALVTDARAGRRAFLETAGDAAEEIVCPLVVEPSDRLEDWFTRFHSRFDRKGDYAAAATYDAACLLFRAAIRASSPQQAIVDRASIVQALRGLSPYDGVTGRIEWDDLGANRRPAELGVVRGGVVRPTASAASH